MERWLRLAALTLAAFTILSTAAQAAPLNLSWQQCPFVETLEADARARVRCGFLSVPEDYAKPRGRIINLAVAVVEPRSGKAADPVVLLHGGPGADDMHGYRYRLGEPFGPRTLVMFDQRGVGRSQPQLCAELGEALFTASVRGLSPDAETAELVAANRRCHDRLVAEGIDLTKYNTATTVADVETLRTALGFERWKVYGISYGTAVGLAYLRDRPTSISALVLDSVYPLDSPGTRRLVPNMMRSLGELSAACANQPACKGRFGDVEALFQRALEGLIQAPLDVPARDATSSWMERVRIGAPGFLTVVHQLLYDESAYPVLPFLIDRVAARDGEMFALLVDEFHERALGITHGAYAAVECYERFPFDSRDEYELEAAPWPRVRDQMTLIVRDFDICANWNEKAEEPMRMPTTRANVPVFVLGGGWDPITPPAYSKQTAEVLGAYYAELPFHGHGVRFDKKCGAPLVRAFFDQPGRAPDVSCTTKRVPPSFVTSLIRAPTVAQEVTALAKHGTPAAAPAGTSLAALLAFMFASAVVWSFVGMTRTLRYGAQAWASFWLRPGVPLGLAALTLCTGLIAFAWTFGSAASSSSPILLMFGLPGESLPVFIWPWAGFGLLVWGALTLLFGAEKADRPTAYAIHLWLVFAAGVAALLLFASFGLLIPDLI